MTYNLNPSEDQYSWWSKICKSYTFFCQEATHSSLKWTEQDGLGMALVIYGVWRPLERTPTHVSKVFSFKKYPALSAHTDRAHAESLTPSPRSTKWIFDYIEAVSLCSFISPILEQDHWLPLSAVSSTALSLAYGIETKPIEDPFLDLAESAIKSLAKAASVGAFLVDLFPILKHVPEFVPGAGFKRQIRIWRKLQEDFRERPYLASVEAMVCIFHLRLTLP